jgi:hypothetical protein
MKYLILALMGAVLAFAQGSCPPGESMSCTVNPYFMSCSCEPDPSQSCCLCYEPDPPYNSYSCPCGGDKAAALNMKIQHPPLKKGAKAPIRQDARVSPLPVRTEPARPLVLKLQ